MTGCKASEGVEGNGNTEIIRNTSVENNFLAVSVLEPYPDTEIYTQSI